MRLKQLGCLLGDIETQIGTICNVNQGVRAVGEVDIYSSVSTSMPPSPCPSIVRYSPRLPNCGSPFGWR